MKSNSGVLCISLLQLIVGFCLLGIYESYKVSYMNATPVVDEASHKAKSEESDTTVLRIRTVSTPLDWLFYLTIFNNAHSTFFCLAGALNSLREVVIAFFTINAIQMVLAFHFFVDVWTDVDVRKWSDGDLGAYERTATAFLFFNFLLSLCATIFGVRAVNDIRTKAREEYHRLSVISDNLQFDPDTEKT